MEALMTDRKVVKLTKVTTKEPEVLTYAGAIQDHLTKLTPAQANAEPITMFLGAITETGIMYSVLAGSDLAQFLGAMELVKQHVLIEELGD